MRPDFGHALDVYFTGCRRIYDAYMDRSFPTNPRKEWRIDMLQKRARIVSGSGAHSFVDYETGDVFKPASWGSPAKHARGNIFDEHHGLGRMGPYGPEYLRGGNIK